MGVQIYAEDRYGVARGQILCRLLSFWFSVSKTPWSTLQCYTGSRTWQTQLLLSSWFPVSVFQLGELEEDWKARKAEGLDSLMVLLPPPVTISLAMGLHLGSGHWFQFPLCCCYCCLFHIPESICRPKLK